MQAMPVWKKLSNKDNIAFAAVIWSALALATAGSLLQLAEPEVLLQSLSQATETAARLLG